MQDLRIVVADDHDSYRASIVALLRRIPHVTVVGEATNGEEALNCVEEVKPDVLILDIVMPRLTGWQVLQRLEESQACVKVVLLSEFAVPPYGPGSGIYGAYAYLTKDEPQAIFATIRELALNA
jgi:two-component system nitrate/nitrite response regulator NarL